MAVTQAIELRLRRMRRQMPMFTSRPSTPRAMVQRLPGGYVTVTHNIISANIRIREPMVEERVNIDVDTG